MPKDSLPQIRGLEVIGAASVPSGGFVLIPNRLSYHELCLLEKVFGNREITYLVDQSHPYDPLLRAHLEKDDVEALAFQSDDADPSALSAALHPLLAKGRCPLVLDWRRAIGCCRQTFFPGAP